MAATKHAQQIEQDSQDYLATALLQLLTTKELADLTVTQVVKRAGVSRMAFYRNFNTLDDVLTAYFGPIITARFADISYRQPTSCRRLATSSPVSQQPSNSPQTGDLNTLSVRSSMIICGPSIRLT